MEDFEWSQRSTEWVFVNIHLQSENGIINIDPLVVANEIINFLIQYRFLGSIYCKIFYILNVG